MAETLQAPIESLTEMETHSIDYIPAKDRHGKVRDQFTLWFAATMNIFNIVLGGVAVFLGLNFLWACIAIVLGTVIGLLLVGFHAVQGPKLGVPQMIQSRGQFGFYGAVLPFVFSIVLDFGFLAAQLVIQADAMNLLVPSISIPAWIALLTIPVFFLAIWGYNWIHYWQRILTVVLGVTFVIVFIQALSYGGLHGAVSGTHAPSFALFMGATGLFVIDMISWAPYVSDYSRYLPENVSSARTFWAVFWGNAIPTIFCGILGAYVTGLLPNASSTVAAIQHVAGGWALLVMALSLVGSDAINAYTGMLALASVLSCFREVRHSQAIRIIGCILMIVAGLICALVGYKQFVNNLSNFLDVLLFVFIPWSAINLADFYLVRHGDYDVQSFFTARGRYGGVLWRGMIPYILAIACEIPFIEQTFYTGPLVKPLGGIDISWVVGGVAGFVLYMLALRIPINGKTAIHGPENPSAEVPAAEVEAEKPPSGIGIA
jgi:nucleobase:cation symporter-1, NCS1 family